MTDKPDEKASISFDSLLLNTVIGFLSVLLLVLLTALVTRIIYPRVFNQRIEAKSQLISNIIQLEVLNGCGTPGIANSFTEVLRKNGFDVVETGNFDRFDVKESLIISRSGVMENAYRVANALGIKKINIIREESPDYYLDVTLVIGEDFKQLNTQ